MTYDNWNVKWLFKEENVWRSGSSKLTWELYEHVLETKKPIIYWETLYQIIYVLK